MKLKFDNAEQLLAAVDRKDKELARREDEMRELIRGLYEDMSDIDREIDLWLEHIESLRRDREIKNSDFYEHSLEEESLEPGTLTWWWFFNGFRPSNRLPPRCPADCI